ncbi:hypothetical protein KA005_21085 [bacterium]|nr:hypothetical protein [bacterium]
MIKKLEGRKALPGKFRVVEYNMYAVDGLSGGPEECMTIIGDYKWLWFAKLVALISICRVRSPLITFLKFVRRYREAWPEKYQPCVINDQGKTVILYDDLIKYYSRNK